jgi:nitroreductase
MKTINRDQLLDQLKWRYATKHFDPELRISPEDWAALENSAFAFVVQLQPWKFIVVTDQAVKEKLAEASCGQRQPADASHRIMLRSRRSSVCQRSSYVNRIAEVRQTSRAWLAGFGRDAQFACVEKRTRHWATRQVYLALGSFRSAALLGIDVCPMKIDLQMINSQPWPAGLIRLWPLRWLSCCNR